MLPIARPSSGPADALARIRDANPTPELAIVKGSRIEKFAARLLYRYLRSTAHRSTVVWCGTDGQAEDGEIAGRRIRALISDREPVIVTYWIADALAVAVMPLLDQNLARLFSAVTCVVDDTFAGRIAGRYIEEIGGSYARLALPGDPERLRQVLDLMTNRTPCAFPVDGGGPYREVGTGIVSLSMTLRAPIVPIAVVSRPALPAVHRSKVRLPMPVASIVAAIGQPLSPTFEGDRRAHAARLEGALEELRVRVRRTAQRHRSAD